MEEHVFNLEKQLTEVKNNQKEQEGVNQILYAYFEEIEKKIKRIWSRIEAVEKEKENSGMSTFKRLASKLSKQNKEAFEPEEIPPSKYTKKAVQRERVIPVSSEEEDEEEEEENLFEEETEIESRGEEEEEEGEQLEEPWLRESSEEEEETGKEIDIATTPFDQIPIQAYRITEEGRKMPAIISFQMWLDNRKIYRVKEDYKDYVREIYYKRVKGKNHKSMNTPKGRKGINGKRKSTSPMITNKETTPTSLPSSTGRRRGTPHSSGGKKGRRLKKREKRKAKLLQKETGNTVPKKKLRLTVRFFHFLIFFLLSYALL